MATSGTGWRLPSWLGGGSETSSTASAPAASKSSAPAGSATGSTPAAPSNAGPTPQSSSAWDSAYEFGHTAAKKTYEVAAYCFVYIGKEMSKYTQDLADVRGSYANLSGLYRGLSNDSSVDTQELTLDKLSKQVDVANRLIIKTLIAGAVITYVFHNVMRLTRSWALSHIPVVSTVASLAHKSALGALALGAYELIALKRAVVAGDNVLAELSRNVGIHQPLDVNTQHALQGLAVKIEKTYRKSSILAAFSTTLNKALQEVHLFWECKRVGDATPTLDSLGWYVDYLAWILGKLGAEQPSASSAGGSGSDTGTTTPTSANNGFITVTPPPTGDKKKDDT